MKPIVGTTLIDKSNNKRYKVSKIQGDGIHTKPKFYYFIDTKGWYNITTLRRFFKLPKRISISSFKQVF